MRWLELSVEVDVEAVEAVSEILGRIGAGTAVQPTRLIRDPDDELAAREDPTAPYVITAHLADEPDAADRVEATERALWHLQAFGLRPVGPLRVRSVDDAEWIDAWKRHYVAQRTGRVVIVPSWAEESLRPDEVAITLDPGMAFGTGLHPTTRGCLELLQATEPMPHTVLDVGCGSGILALAALRLGAVRALGIDTDPLAVAASRENAERNGLADRFEAREGTLPAVALERYPLVLANLVAVVLVELSAPLAAHLAPGGTLLASGIIEPRAGEVEESMRSAGLVVGERRVDGEWVSLRLERPA
ncbi:MAG TPA: 50S ribosomal protein L11 methyltransferase [Candidatus Limnocylindrales bacterium]|nr:50S ribosomal protein L11 methyltransferase [Candidatus Limnocylindrales bacterium]